MDLDVTSYAAGETVVIHGDTVAQTPNVPPCVAATIHAVRERDAGSSPSAQHPGERITLV